VANTLKTTSMEIWSRAQTAALVVACLLAGTAGGWLLRRATAAPLTRQTETVATSAPVASQPAQPNFRLQSSLPSNQQLKEAADSQAAPILEKLQAEPNNAALLASVGNLYYDAKEYPTAIDYYERSLKAQPADTSVRTDLGTAYWYNGDANTAISEFQKVLSYEPAKATALFNLGVVKWKGKNDPAGAIAAWQGLLAANPGFEARAKVEEMIAQAQDTMTKKP